MADSLLKHSVVVTIVVIAADIRKDLDEYLFGARHGAITFFKVYLRFPL